MVDSAADNLQCPTKIPLGQLTVEFYLNVFKNKTSGFIVIETLVSIGSLTVSNVGYHIIIIIIIIIEPLYVWDS